MNIRRRWLVAALLLIAAAGVAAWQWQGRALPVKLVRARTGPAVELVYATGYVEPQQPVSVQARITAPVAQVLVAEGDRVNRGQALFVLADDEQRALQIGLACRFAFALTASSAGVLPHYRLRMTPAKVILEVPRRQEAIAGEPVQKRLGALAAVFGRKGAILIG